MNEEQKEAWAAAQKISIGEDLIAAAQKQLQFLAAVDRQRWLYSSPGVERAIYRYKTCWLPLLAKYSENDDQEDRLVVPIDCEWIWHCHRLNPVQYKKDCDRVYGRILDNKNVVSSVSAETTNQSRKIWAEFYPDEPFELDYQKILSHNYKPVEVNTETAGMITYDLAAAVQRQSSFYYQVSRPFTSDPRFLAEALARYKGFLYLIKSNQLKSLEVATVPTFDVDLMWHSHQLHPASYCKDLTSFLGEVLQHDDTDPDRSVGKKLHNGFNETTKQFEDTFGLRYWKAGAMYQGPAPGALTTEPFASNSPVRAPLKSLDGLLSLPSLRVVEVLLEIVDVKNAELHESETLYVSFTKKQRDMHFREPGNLSILSLTGKKNVACFNCEPMGDLDLILIAKSDRSPERVLGTSSISLVELTAACSNLSTEKWFQLNQTSIISNSDPIYLRVAISSTPPFPSSLTMHMVRSDKEFLPSLPIPYRGVDNSTHYWTSFIDVFGNPIIWVTIRDIIPENDMAPNRVILAVTNLSGTPLVLAEGRDNQWSFNEASNFYGTAEIKAGEDGTYHCKLNGNHGVKLYWGKKLEYEKFSKTHADDCASITAVQFSKNHPYGSTIAGLDMNHSLCEVNEEWFILPWATLSLVFMNMKESNSSTNTLCGTHLNGASGGNCASELVYGAPSGIYISKLINGGPGGVCNSKLVNGAPGGVCNSKLVGMGSYGSEACVDGLAAAGDTGNGAGCLKKVSESSAFGTVPAVGKKGGVCYGFCTGKGTARCYTRCIKPVGEGGASLAAAGDKGNGAGCLKKASESSAFETVPAVGKQGGVCYGFCTGKGTARCYGRCLKPVGEGGASAVAME